jgi:hypothetical protein
MTTERAHVLARFRSVHTPKKSCSQLIPFLLSVTHARHLLDSLSTPRLRRRHDRASDARLATAPPPPPPPTSTANRDTLLRRLATRRPQPPCAPTLSLTATAHCLSGRPQLTGPWRGHVIMYGPKSKPPSRFGRGTAMKLREESAVAYTVCQIHGQINN